MAGTDSRSPKEIGNKTSEEFTHQMTSLTCLSWEETHTMHLFCHSTDRNSTSPTVRVWYLVEF